MSRKAKIFFSVLSIVIISLAILIPIFTADVEVILDYCYTTDFWAENTKTEVFTINKYTYFIPERPTRTGYIFKGWYRDAGYTIPWINGVDKVKSDITLYAKWE